MPFEITTTGVAPFFRGHTSTGYGTGERVVVLKRAAASLEAAQGDVADFVTDYRRVANALISEWREFYRQAARWDGESALTLTLPNQTVIEAAPITEGELRRIVQTSHPQEDVVEKSLGWVVGTYNTDRRKEH